MSAVCSLFHIVINTLRREMPLPDDASQQSAFPLFRGWGKEYGAFSCSVRDKDSIVNYIINQREHHYYNSDIIG